MKHYLHILIIFLILTGLACQKELSTSPEDVLLPDNQLFIDSNPQGSKIFIDGLYLGQRTPDTIKWLVNGDHLITLKTNLLKDSSYVINITDGFQSVFFDYTTNPTMRGNLYCDSYPLGAEIYINDSNTTLKTPELIRGLFPSVYQIKYKLPGYWDATVKATVVSERTVTADTNLPDSTVWVNFTSANTGLPTDWYNDIDIQYGYIKWLASEGSGLIKYISGNNYTEYNTSNSSIPSNNINNVKVEGDNIWIATNKGAALFRNGNFTVYNSSNSNLADSITCLSPMPGGKLWAGSRNKGIFYFDGINWTNYNKDNSGVKTNEISTIVGDQYGNAWIGTVGQGLILFDGINWLKIFNALPSPKVDALIISDNDIWVGTSFHTGYTYAASNATGGPPQPRAIFYNGGLAHLQNNTWTKYKKAGREIFAMAKDTEGNLWYSDYSVGLIKKSSSGDKILNNYNNINGIVIDGEGNKWLSTFFKGIVKYKGN